MVENNRGASLLQSQHQTSQILNDSDNVGGSSRVVVRIRPPSSISANNNSFCDDDIPLSLNQNGHRRNHSDDSVNSITSSIHTSLSGAGNGSPTFENHKLSPMGTLTSRLSFQNLNFQTQEDEQPCCVFVLHDGKEVQVKEPPNEHFKEGKVKVTSFSFDCVFPCQQLNSKDITRLSSEEWRLHQQREQEEFYTCSYVADAVNNVVTAVSHAGKKPVGEVVIAYGATGAGKSYTMIGTMACPGLLPRSLSDIFFKLEALVEPFVVEVSIVEVYNSTFKDLLLSRKGNKLTQQPPQQSSQQHQQPQLILKRVNSVKQPDRRRNSLTAPHSNSSGNSYSYLLSSSSSPPSVGLFSRSEHLTEFSGSPSLSPTYASNSHTPDDIGAMLEAADSQIDSNGGANKSPLQRVMSFKPSPSGGSAAKATYHTSVYATPSAASKTRRSSGPITPSTSSTSRSSSKSDSPSVDSEHGVRLRVNSTTEALELLRMAPRRKKTAKRLVSGSGTEIASSSSNSTRKPYDSARGHVVFTVHVSTRLGASKLVLVDLAGPSSGTSPMETQHINISLLTLGEVLQTLSSRADLAYRKQLHSSSSSSSSGVQKQKSSSSASKTFIGQSSSSSSGRVPYLDSKLTQLLAGHSRLLLLACIQPEQALYGSTMRTLHFASRARPLLRPPTVHLHRRASPPPTLPSPPEQPSLPLERPSVPLPPPPETSTVSHMELLESENLRLRQQVHLLQSQLDLLTKHPSSHRRSLPPSYSSSPSSVSPLAHPNGFYHSMNSHSHDGHNLINHHTMQSIEEGAVEVMLPSQELADSSQVDLGSTVDDELVDAPQQPLVHPVTGSATTADRASSLDTGAVQVANPSSVAPTPSKVPAPPVLASNRVDLKNVCSKSFKLQNPYCCYYLQSTDK